LKAWRLQIASDAFHQSDGIFFRGLNFDEYIHSVIRCLRLAQSIVWLFYTYPCQRQHAALDVDVVTLEHIF